MKLYILMVLAASSVLAMIVALVITVKLAEALDPWAMPVGILVFPLFLLCFCKSMSKIERLVWGI